jgi:hypothetical protein
VRLPPFLLVDDSDTDTQAFVGMVKRIGLVNSVQPVTTIDQARQYLAACVSAPPLVIFVPAAFVDGESAELFAWMEEQDPPISDIPTLTLEKPLEMYSVIGALKALSFPERARIDTTTLTVRVELWPHGTLLDR